MRRIQSALESDDRVILRKSFGRRRGKKFPRFSRLRMHVDDLHVPLRNSSSHPLEHKVLRTRNFTQRQVLRRRTNEDQIIVLSVVQPDKTSYRSEILVHHTQLVVL